MMVGTVHNYVNIKFIHILISCIFAEVTIGLENTAFTATEGIGTIKVCVNLNCPGTRPNCSVSFPFGVNFSTVDDTAGTHTHFPQ